MKIYDSLLKIVSALQQPANRERNFRPRKRDNGLLIFESLLLFWTLWEKILCEIVVFDSEYVFRINVIKMISLSSSRYWYTRSSRS